VGNVNSDQDGGTADVGSSELTGAATSTTTVRGALVNCRAEVSGAGAHEEREKKQPSSDAHQIHSLHNSDVIYYRSIRARSYDNTECRLNSREEEGASKGHEPRSRETDRYDLSIKASEFSSGTTQYQISKGNGGHLKHMRDRGILLTVGQSHFTDAVRSQL